MSFYDLEARKLNGERIKMKEFEGKTVVVVNTASKCGLTPQYKGLENLYKKYKDDGLVILGFPSNQFANQEPGTSDEIEEFCQVNYGVSFPMFEKIDVNGNNTHPVFKFLKGRLGGFLGSRIKWNFTKFVIDGKGRPIKRFSPTTKPEKMEAVIEKTLKKYDHAATQL
jgi:glutathione peroxidase